MVRSGSAAHPSNCTLLWCSKQPHSTRKIFLGKLKCVAQARPLGGGLARKPWPGPTPGPRLLDLLFLLCIFCTTPSPARPPTLFSELLHGTSAATSPPQRPKIKIASHQRINVGISAIGLSLVTFFGIRKNIVVQACCGHLPLCSTLSKNSTIPPLVSSVKSKGTLGWKPSHPPPVFALYILDAVSKSLSDQPR